MSSVVKVTVAAGLVKLLFHRQFNRGMRLIEFETRCVRQGEIHELVTTDHQSAVVGERIDRVGFLGFVEIHNGGVIERGDQVWIDDSLVGTVLGFDDCHFPNHYNILIAVDCPVTAADLGLSLEQSVSFRPFEPMSERSENEFQRNSYV